MTEKNNNKFTKSVNVQSELKEILSSLNIKGISKSFSTFYDYFEDHINYLHSVFKHENRLSNTSINITEYKTNMINNFVKEGIVANFSEGIRFIFLLGIYELKRSDFTKDETIMDYYLRLSNNKNEEEKPKKTDKPTEDEEMKEILSRVISIEEYNKKNNNKTI